MLQAVLKAVLQAKEGDIGGDLSPLSVNDLTTRDPAVPGVHSAGVDVGGFGGARRRKPRAPREPRKPRQVKPIEFWHDLFRHINSTLGHPYPWQNSDRKILANAARKYGVPSLMAMWDFYLWPENTWSTQTGGSIYGMVRDAARLLDQPGFKDVARSYERRLLKQYGVYDAILNQ